MARVSYYPPSPREVPDDLTKPSSEYQTQAFLVLASLIIFFSFYFLAIIGLLTVFVLSLVLICPPASLIIAIPSGLALLFMVKGFFKREQPQRSFRIEITAEQHPKLFDFIERLCDETGAPRPYRVFLSPEVNAAVFYNDSVLNFFVPPPKNLLIGIGLINFLNLSEFKAVLAHEFGHFAQRSMALYR